MRNSKPSLTERNKSWNSMAQTVPLLSSLKTMFSKKLKFQNIKLQPFRFSFFGPLCKWVCAPLFGHVQDRNEILNFLQLTNLAQLKKCNPDLEIKANPNWNNNWMKLWLSTLRHCLNCIKGQRENVIQDLSSCKQGLRLPNDNRLHWINDFFEMDTETLDGEGLIDFIFKGKSYCCF